MNSAIPDVSPSLHQQQHCESRPSFCLLTSTRPADTAKNKPCTKHMTPLTGTLLDTRLRFTTCCYAWTNM